jgi:transposase, IS5 family
MKQLSFAQAKFAAKPKTTRRERFLAEMELVVPWSRRLEALQPFDYPDSPGRRGRPPIGLERMLPMYVLQQWYGLADEAVDDAVYDRQALRHFIGIDLGRETVPDATTVLGFRRLLEDHALTAVILATVNAELTQRGLLLKEGTLVDATILNTAASTKNRAKARDAAMHSTRKGNQGFFGMKAHIGADADSGLVHTVVTTAANVADVTAGARPGRASLPPPQEPLQLPQGALQRIGEERRAAAHALCARQPGHRQKRPVGGQATHTDRHLLRCMSPLHVTP